MDEPIKQRLVGAAVLSLLAALLLPLLFGNPKDPRSSIQPSFSGPPLPQPSARDIQLFATPTPLSAAQAGIQTRAKPEPSPMPVKPASRPRPSVSRPSPTPVITTAKPAGTPASGWVLQLASYRKQSAAEDFLKKLRKDGYQAYRESVHVKGKTYHRVRLGLSMSRKEANDLQKKLEKKYRLQAQLLEAR